MGTCRACRLHTPLRPGRAAHRRHRRSQAAAPRPGGFLEHGGVIRVPEAVIQAPPPQRTAYFFQAPQTPVWSCGCQPARTPVRSRRPAPRWRCGASPESRIARFRSRALSGTQRLSPGHRAPRARLAGWHRLPVRQPAAAAPARTKQTEQGLQQHDPPQHRPACLQVQWARPRRPIRGWAVKISPRPILRSSQARQAASLQGAVQLGAAWRPV